MGQLFKSLMAVGKKELLSLDILDFKLLNLRPEGRSVNGLCWGRLRSIAVVLPYHAVMQLTPRHLKLLTLSTSRPRIDSGGQTGVLKEWLWETLETLGTEELKNFKWCLQNVTESRDGFKPIKKSRLENADRLDTVDLMVQMYDTKTAAVTKKILKKIKRNEGQPFPQILLQDQPANATGPRPWTIPVVHQAVIMCLPFKAETQTASSLDDCARHFSQTITYPLCGRV
uniref:uncharacterized protein LOC112430396 n=1 Tax=Maylandia zebra TaxID=106582 RepID=UPI000D31A1B5|nr:uncharacterized protein LOC112430396 [Maylandia zebra]